MAIITRSLKQGELVHLSHLLNELKLSTYYKSDAIFEGKDPILKSPHFLGEAVATALFLEAISASVIWKHRTNQDNAVKINIFDAIHYLHPVHFVWQSGYNMDLGADKVPINYCYRCQDNRHIWIQCGPPYPKLQNGYLNFFNCGNNRDAIGKIIAQWNSFELEKKLAELNLPGCVVRTKDEWYKHPQGMLLSNTPVIEIEKIADTKPIPFTDKASSALTGINILDMTHVLAGPRSMMSLAEYGANVLQIVPPHHLDPKTINIGVNHGKKSAFLDLEDARDFEVMGQLLNQADVFTNSYRPSVMNRFKLNVDDVLSLNNKGLVYTSINAFGHQGPWKNRPGFDQNAQMVSGFSVNEGSFDKPKPSPVYYINDLLTAYFAAAGTMIALHRRALEGGSYHVKVSLTKSCMWAQEFGLISKELLQEVPDKDSFPQRLTKNLKEFTYPPKLIEDLTVYGPLTRLAPAVECSTLPRTPLTPVVNFGSCKTEF